MMNKVHQKLILGGSTFESSAIGQHSDLPTNVNIFRNDRDARLNKLAEKIVTKTERNQTLSLIPQVPFLIGRYFMGVENKEFNTIQQFHYGGGKN